MVTRRLFLLLSIGLVLFAVLFAASPSAMHPWSPWTGLSAHPFQAAALWWLVLFAIGVMTLPWMLCVGHRLPDAGYALGKTLGLLFLAYFCWLPPAIRVAPNSPTLIWAVWFMMLACVIVFLVCRRHSWPQFSRQQLRIIVLEEALFSVAFICFVFFRMANPDLWQPWRGGEKFMEHAILLATVSSSMFPPYDPNFAGATLNYYYWGYHIVNVLTKLTGVSTTVAFNLAVATFFSLTVVSVFALASAFRARFKPRLRSMILCGLLGILFVAISGPLDGAYELFREPAGYVERDHLEGYNFWRPTRILPYTINEFPYCTFLFADLHPHLIVIPVFVLLVGLAMVFREEHAPRSSLSAWVLISMLTVTLGAVSVINPWNMPVAVVLVCCSLPGWRSKMRLAGSVGLIAIMSFVFFLPFHLQYSAVGVGGIGSVMERTSLGPWLRLWGFWYFLVLTLGVALQESREGRPFLPYAVAAGLAVLLAVSGWHVPALLSLPLVLLGFAFVRTHRPAWAFPALLIAVALGVLLGLEVFYVRDFLDTTPHYRMNSTFKFGLQAWILLGCGLSMLWPQLMTFVQSWTRLIRWTWMTLFTLLLTASLVYPVMATPSRLADRFDMTPKGPTLDGLAFMDTAEFRWPGSGQKVSMKGDAEAIRWLRKHIKQTAPVAEASLSYYRHAGGRVSTFTGLPTLLGAHQYKEQRPADVVLERRALVTEFWETDNITRTHEIIDHLDIAFVYIGPIERMAYPASGIEKFSRMKSMRQLMELYSEHDVTVYGVPDHPAMEALHE